MGHKICCFEFMSFFKTLVPALKMDSHLLYVNTLLRMFMVVKDERHENRMIHSVFHSVSVFSNLDSEANNAYFINVH